MRTLIVGATFGLVCTLFHPAPAQESVGWTGQLVVAVGELFDAPGGNVIGHLDQRKMKVDRWEGDWALVTGEREPRIGWIERKSVRQILQYMMLVPTRRVPARPQD